jgi:hypothetical protein
LKACKKFSGHKSRLPQESHLNSPSTG